MSSIRRPWRRPVWVVLALAAVMVLCAVPALLGASGQLGGSLSESRDLAQVEGLSYWDVNAQHSGSSRDVHADAVNWSRCARAAWRAAHLGTCPSAAAYRLQGIRLPAGRAGTQRQADLGASVVGAWVRRVNIPSLAIHAAMLPTGKVLLFAYPDSSKQASVDYAQAFLWDPVGDPQAQSVQEVDPPIDPTTGKPFNIWCGGQTFLADGELLVAGGTLKYDGTQNGVYFPFEGHYLLLTFNPWTERWTVQPRMDHGRWYPTVVRLPDGRALIIGGYDEGGNGLKNLEAEVFTPSAQPGGAGTLAHLASADFQPTNVPSLYPHLFVVPGGTNDAGEVLMAGPGLGDSKVLDLGDLAKGWTNPDRTPKFTDVRRTYGSAVLMPYGSAGPERLMLIGGYNDSGTDPDATGDATDTTAVLDLTKKGTVGWSYEPGPTMHCWPIPDPDAHNPNPGGNCVGRAHNNTVILPDSSLVTVGGGRGAQADAQGETSLYSDPIYPVELYSPQTDSWTVGPAQTDARTYHSTAVLLPDGSVLSAGDDRPEHQDAAARTAEVYDPAYLFRGARPTIADVPAVAGYGQAIGIATPDAASVAKVVLVAPSAVTHFNDMNQRAVDLDFTASANGLTATTPQGPTYAPPGYYMLFLVNAQGVPSVARWVRLYDPATTLGPPPSAGTGVAEGAPSGAVTTPPTGSSGSTAAAPVAGAASARVATGRTTLRRPRLSVVRHGRLLRVTVRPPDRRTISGTVRLQRTIRRHGKVVRLVVRRRFWLVAGRRAVISLPLPGRLVPGSGYRLAVSLRALDGSRSSLVAFVTLRRANAPRLSVRA